MTWPFSSKVDKTIGDLICELIDTKIEKLVEDKLNNCLTLNHEDHVMESIRRNNIYMDMERRIDYLHRLNENLIQIVDRITKETNK